MPIDGKSIVQLHSRIWAKEIYKTLNLKPGQLVDADKDFNIIVTTNIKPTKKEMDKAALKLFKEIIK